MMNVLESLQIAEKLASKKLTEADVAVQGANPQPAANQQQSPANGAIDQNALEKAFEQALTNMQQGIVEQFQNSLKEFGESLVKQLKGNNDNSDEQKMLNKEGMQPSSNNGNNENNGGNKDGN